MRTGDYLVESFLLTSNEPVVWEVAGIDRGKVNLCQVNPASLVRTGETKRVDLYRAKRMKKYDPSRGDLARMVRALREQKAEIRRYIEALPTEAESDG